MRRVYEEYSQYKFDSAMAESNAAKIASNRKNEFSTLRQNSTLATRTINQIPTNVTLTNINPKPTDQEKLKDYIGDITLISVSETDGNVIITSSGPRHLGKMSPVNFLITTGIASFEPNTHLLKINQETLDQYLPQQTLISK